MYRDLPELYIPMLWFRQHAEITPDLADMVNMILKVPTIGLALFYTVAVIGLIMLLTSCYFISKRNRPHVTWTEETNNNLSIHETVSTKF